jgi:hypothetical protein
MVEKTWRTLAAYFLCISLTSFPAGRARSEVLLDTSVGYVRDNCAFQAAFASGGCFQGMRGALSLQLWDGRHHAEDEVGTPQENLLPSHGHIPGPAGTSGFQLGAGNGLAFAIILVGFGFVWALPLVIGALTLPGMQYGLDFSYDDLHDSAGHAVTRATYGGHLNI